MKTLRLVSVTISIFLIITACGQKESSGKPETQQTPSSGQSAVIDNKSQKDVLKVAIGSPDHTTLVAAVKTAELVDALSNAGPFTVFAPTNAAFDKLPKGTVDNLLKPENKGKLQDILQHHVTTSAYTEVMLRDGLKLGMVDGNNVIVTMKDGSTFIDNAKVLGSVRASNGMVYIVDQVILPKGK